MTAPWKALGLQNLDFWYQFPHYRAVQLWSSLDLNLRFLICEMRGLEYVFQTGPISFRGLCLCGIIHYRFFTST